MKIKENVIHRSIAGEHILIPTGDTAIKYNGIFSMTEIGAEIWEKLAEGMEEDAIIAAILEDYDVDEATLRQDYAEFVAKLTELGYTGAYTIEREISGEKQIEDIIKARELLRSL